MTRTVVVVDGEATTRAAHSLASHPGVDSVALLGPSSSNHFETVESVEGFDVVVGAERAVHLARDARLPVVGRGDIGGLTGVSGASIEGLALSLAVGVADIESVAVAVPGDAEGSADLTFPSPIDHRAGRRAYRDGHELWVATGPGDLAAAMVRGRDRHRVVMDHALFLEGIALAAGIGVILEEWPSEPVPAWTRATIYLRTATEMGVVIGERAAPAA